MGVDAGGSVGGSTGAAVIGGAVTPGDGAGVGAVDGALHFTGVEDPVKLPSPDSSPLSGKTVSGAHPKLGIDSDGHS